VCVRATVVIELVWQFNALNLITLWGPGGEVRACASACDNNRRLRFVTTRRVHGTVCTSPTTTNAGICISRV
jgi:hypothetical protein